MRRYFYAVDNGHDYSDHTIYLFASEETPDTIDALVEAANVGYGNEQWKVLVGAEVLRHHVELDVDTWGSWLDNCVYRGSYSDTGTNPVKALVDASALMSAALREYREAQETARQKRIAARGAK